MIHSAPSNVCVDTLIETLRGSGNHFTDDLRTFFVNTGVPNGLLDELPRILVRVKYHSVFVGYGEPDRAFAEKLVNSLGDSGVSCWLYSLDYTIGERTWEEIKQRRQEAEKMIVICSALSLARQGALKEIEEQIDEDPGKIVPISLDNIWKEPSFLVVRTGRDLKPFLMERNYGDFSNELNYKRSLDRLLIALEKKRITPRR